MPASHVDEVREVLKLLERGAQSDRAARFVEAENRVSRHFAGAADWLLTFCVEAVKADVAGNTLVQDAVSFLRDEDLPLLAHQLLALPDRDIEELLAIVALQAPSLLPDQFSALLDYHEWASHSDPLDPPASYHLVFDGGSPLSLSLSLAAHRLHPTWHLPATGPECRIGGKGFGTCAACGQPLIHLITLEHVPSDLGVSLPSLRLETCPTCSEPTFYEHDERGLPTALVSSELLDSQWTQEPIVERRASLARTPERWARQSSTLSNSRQNLFKIGGLPSWVQGADIPTGPQSGRAMNFLLQFDSGLATADGGELLWGSGGILYVFWDDVARVSCHFHQCT